MSPLADHAGDRDAVESGLASVDRSSAEIRCVDDFVSAVLDQLAAIGMSRTELAKRADLNAASLRRLLTDPAANPTLNTMRRITTVLGLRLGLHKPPN